MNKLLTYTLGVLFFFSVIFSLNQCGEDGAEVPTSQDNTDTPSDNTDTPSESTDIPSENTDTPSENTDIPSENTDIPPEHTTPYFIDKNGKCIGEVLNTVDGGRYQVQSIKGYVTELDLQYYHLAKVFTFSAAYTSTNDGDGFVNTSDSSWSTGIWKDYLNKIYFQYRPKGGSVVSGTKAKSAYDFVSSSQDAVYNTLEIQYAEGVTPVMDAGGSSSSKPSSVGKATKTPEIEGNEEQIYQDTGFRTNWASPATVVDKTDDYACADHQ